MKQLVVSTLIALLSSCSTFEVRGKEHINIADIIKAGAEVDFSSCVEIEVKGACFWWKFSGFTITTTSTLIVEHYTPDAVVNVYSDIEDSPFKNTQWITKAFSSVLGNGTSGGEKTNKRSERRKQGNIYRHADVYGSPAAATLTQLMSQLPLGLNCEPSTTVFQPYFISASNPLIWYSGIVDNIVNFGGIVTGDRWVGEREDGEKGGWLSSNPTWAGLYPRTGVMLHYDHYKASAVAAQRAMDSVFNGNFGIYNTELGGDQSSWYQPSEKIEEWDSHEGKWQMLYPYTDTKCHILGDESFKDDGAKSDGWAERRSENGAYSWHYWRRYKCCQKPSGYNFLFKIGG